MPFTISKTDIRAKIKHPGKLLLLALLGTPLTLLPLYEGLKQTSSFEASLLSAIGPIFTIFGGWLILKEKLNKSEKLGASLALIGTLIITFVDGGHKDFSLGNGNLLIVLSNIIWTAFLLLSKRLKADPIQTSLISYAVGALFFGLYACFQGIPLVTKSLFNSSNLLLIGYLSLFGSVVAFWAYYKAQTLIEASEAAIFTYLHPVFAFPLSIFWLKESISTPIMLGLALVVFGVFLSQRATRVLK